MSGLNDMQMEIFKIGLRNQHAVEEQAISLLSDQVKRLENNPEMGARMRQHFDDSKMQSQQPEELLSELGTSHSSLKVLGLSFMGNMAALAHTVAPDEVIKNSFVNYASEHFEIASYKSLLTVADAVGHDGAKAALQQSLDEELDMTRWLGENLAATTMRYFERSMAGVKTGL